LSGKKIYKMKLKKIYIILMVAVSIVLLGAGFMAGFFQGAAYTEKFLLPVLKITGDIKRPAIIDNPAFLSGEAKLAEEKITYNQKNVKAFKLKDIINFYEPFSQYFSIYITGHDGKTARMYSEQIKDCYLGFSYRNGWEAINPGQSEINSIKGIEEIIIVSDRDTEKIYDYGLNVISTEENLFGITPGEARLKSRAFFDVTQDLHGEGESKLDGDCVSGSEKTGISSYVKRNILTFQDIMESFYYAEQNPEEIRKNIDSFFDGGNFVIMGERGQYLFSEGPGYFEVGYNNFNYIEGDNENIIEDVKGIMLNPVESNITDVYRDSLNYLEQGRAVLFIITDGFGYHQFLKTREDGFMPFMGSLESSGGVIMKKALSMYRPVTNTGLAAMLTGKTPAENGIYSGDQRELMVPSIFKELQEMGKSSIFIEGDVKKIKTEIDPVLNTDKNKDGTIDDEIFESAMESMEDNYDFMAVHFHSIDDNGHNCGDISESTFEAVRMVDSFIERLVKKWDGAIIITSDHGMHPDDTGGSHGQFRYEDLVVPYILIYGK
jgi:hypothetical protein